MTDERKERKGVVIPESSAAKRHVNEKLMTKKMFTLNNCRGNLSHLAYP